MPRVQRAKARRDEPVVAQKAGACQENLLRHLSLSSMPYGGPTSLKSTRNTLSGALYAYQRFGAASRGRYRPKSLVPPPGALRVDTNLHSETAPAPRRGCFLSAQYGGGDVGGTLSQS